MIKNGDSSPKFSTYYNGIHYNANNNLFVTKGNISFAGNNYFTGLRLSIRMYILLDICNGHVKTFLNSIKIYTQNGGVSIGNKYYNDEAYSEDFIKREAQEIIIQWLMALNQEDENYNEKKIKNLAHKLVDETYRNQIETDNDIRLNNPLLNQLSLV